MNVRTGEGVRALSLGVVKTKKPPPINAEDIWTRHTGHLKDVTGPIIWYLVCRDEITNHRGGGIVVQPIAHGMGLYSAFYDFTRKMIVDLSQGEITRRAFFTHSIKDAYACCLYEVRNRYRACS